MRGTPSLPGGSGRPKASRGRVLRGRPDSSRSRSGTYPSSQVSILPEIHDELAPLVTCALLDEVGDALSFELTGRCDFEDHAVRQVEVGPLVEEVLRNLQRGRVFGEHDLDQCVDFAIEGFWLAESVDEVMALSHGAAEHCANEVPLLGLSTACEFGDLRGTGPAGGDVPVDLRHAPPGAVGGNYEITYEGQFQPAARTHAVH